LLSEAIAAGAHVMPPARCERIEPSPPRVAVRDLVTNRLSTIASSVLLVADGKGAFSRPPPTGDLGVKAHFSGVDDVVDAISLFALDGHYVGLAPIEGGRWNLAMSAPAAKVRRFGGDLQGLFEQILKENVGLRRRLRGAARYGNWLASPLPRFAVRRIWPPNVIPIGNAAA